ncbi:MAG: ABC transporter substrate-binding protein [Methylococcales bacterium]
MYGQRPPLLPSKLWIQLLLSFFVSISCNVHVLAAIPTRQPIKALYIPLADHYAALVAFERYRDKMHYADFQLEQMKNWDLLRAYFQSGEVDMAYVMSPLAISMFQEKPHFRWVGLMHRDGNALAINALLNKDVQLPSSRSQRKPNSKVAEALIKAHKRTGRATEIGMPHLLSTHSVVLYRYLKTHQVSMALKSREPSQVLAIAVPPPKSPAFILGKSNRAEPAAFEQSLPWADVVETGGFGYVAWYSKDVMPWPHGHVECIAVATDQTITRKFDALKEVMHYIRQAGADIEKARSEGGTALEAIVEIVRKHIPAHSREAIIASLDPKLRVINYQHLDVDKPGLQQIMELAIEGGILTQTVDIDAFADERFGSAKTKILAKE